MSRFVRGGRAPPTYIWHASLCFRYFWLVDIDAWLGNEYGFREFCVLPTVARSTLHAIAAWITRAVCTVRISTAWSDFPIQI